jgi:hypothetical protein
MTPDELRFKVDSLEPKFFGRYHMQVRKNRRYHNLDYEEDIVPPGSSVKARILPTARRAIDEPADHILSHPKITVPIRPTKSERSSEQDIAERKRQFLNAWWTEIDNRFAPISGNKRAFLNEGRIAVRKTLRFDLLPDLPEDGKITDKYRREVEALGRKDFLWRVEILDNVTVLEDISNHRDPEWVYVKHKILTEEAKRRWPEIAKREIKPDWWQLDDFDEVDYIEYWSKPYMDEDGEEQPGQFVQWVNETNVWDEDNPYPYIPIAIEDAGFGVNHSMAKPEEKYVGLTQFDHEVFVMESIQASSIQSVTELSAFPLVKTRNFSDGKTIKIGPGQILPLEGGLGDPDAEDVEIVSWPEIPRSVDRMLEKVDRVANSRFKLDVLGGLPVRGVETATEADQNVRNATALLGPPIAGLERLINRLSAQVLIDVEKVLRAPVTIYAAVGKSDGELTLGPKDINGFYVTASELTTTDADAIAENKARFWLEAPLRSPFMPYSKAMERGGISDEPQKDMVIRAAEDVFLSPQMQQIRLLTAASSFGELIQMMQQIQDGGLSGGAPGVNQGNTLGGAPTGQEGIFQQALTNRDTQQGATQLQA